MAFNADGSYTPEDASVSSRVNGLLTSGNPYIEQAKTAGIAYANKRGLLNSSIGGEATQKAAYDAALPIASQEAQQINQQNLQYQQGQTQQKLQGMQGATQEKIAGASTASYDREKLAGNIAGVQAGYDQALAAISTSTAGWNAGTMDHLLQVAKDTRSSGMALLEQVYNVDLNW